MGLCQDGYLRVYTLPFESVAFLQSFPLCFLSVKPYFRLEGLWILWVQLLKTHYTLYKNCIVLYCFDTPFQVTIVQSYQDAMFVYLVTFLKLTLYSCPNPTHSETIWSLLDNHFMDSISLTCLDPDGENTIFKCICMLQLNVFLF